MAEGREKLVFPWFRESLCYPELSALKWKQEIFACYYAIKKYSHIDANKKIKFDHFLAKFLRKGRYLGIHFSIPQSVHFS